jgi:uncharacterized protein (DUF2147 family)
MIENNRFSVNKTFLSLVFIILSLLTTSIFAATTPVGRWRTIDDKTNRQRSIVVITQHNNRLYGRIVKIYYRPGEVPKRICVKCKDPRFRNKKILGMQILWGAQRRGNSWWGRILDPENGKIYRAKLTLQKGGKVLDVRGYIGVSLFGRTQKWYRI